MAAGILAIGFVFIAGMFPVGVKLTALAAEQTIAPIAVDEAIAKIKLYADPNFVGALWQAQLRSGSAYIDFSDLMLQRGFPIDQDEFTYPSADIRPELKKYHWSALCRRIGLRDVHVIVFVSRKAGAGARYRYYDQFNAFHNDGRWPVPVKMVVGVGDDERRLIIGTQDQRSYISTGSTIVDDATGRVYRVLKRRLDNDNIVFKLDRKLEGYVAPPANVSVWVVPPAVGSGRNPCVRVDPTHTIRF